MSEIVPNPPFNAIKRVDDRGEHWTARDLMPLMAYSRWNEFKSVLDRAMAAAANLGYDVGNLFRVNPEKTAGRPREDFRLTRRAAYLVAMNGDPRKPEVAAAQAYFAIRTEEAERAEAAPAPRELSRLDLIDLAREAELERIKEAARADAAEQRAAELEPAAEAWNDLADSDGDYSVREAAQILNRSPHISTGQNRLFKTMHDIGWIDSTSQPYQRHVDADRLRRRALTYRHPSTGESMVTSQVRITAKGIDELRRWFGNGQLELIGGA